MNKALSVLQTLKKVIELSHFNNSGITFGRATFHEVSEGIAELEELIKLTEPKTCEWVVDDPDFNTYKTWCGQYFTLIEGNLKDNDVKYCSYCGGTIEEPKVSE